jgi:glycine C-acetyltransferase
VSLTVLDLFERGGGLRRRLRENARHFRAELTRAGFELLPGEHPIIPVMLREAPLAQELSRRLLAEGVYVVGFFFPVVPRGQARVRTQLSAAHTREDLDHAVAAFVKVGKELGVIR